MVEQHQFGWWHHTVVPKLFWEWKDEEQLIKSYTMKMIGLSKNLTTHKWKKPESWLYDRSDYIFTYSTCHHFEFFGYRKTQKEFNN